jgi:hypothetical protein
LLGRKVFVATLANAILKTFLLFYLNHINKDHNAPTLHMPYKPSVSAHYQCLHLSLRLRYGSPSLIFFVPTN